MVLSREDMVEHGTLVVVDILCITTCLIEHLRQTHHIVSITCLRALLAGEHRREVVGGMEMFSNTVSSDTDCTMLYHYIPKQTSRSIPIIIPLDIGDTLITDHLRNLSIGMHTRKTILTS